MRRRVLTLALFGLTAGLGLTQSAEACCWGFHTYSHRGSHTKTYTCAPTTYSCGTTSCGTTCAPAKTHHHAKPAAPMTPAPPATTPPPAPPKTSMAPAAAPQYRLGWYYRPVVVRGR